MAESIALLAREDQDVWITNPKAGCTMEMLAKDFMVLPVAEQLIERYGDDLVCVSYMNTSGRLKALAGKTGGAVCTSSNAHKVVEWARRNGQKVLFVPDEHLGRNTAARLGMDLSKVVRLASAEETRGAFPVDDAHVEGGLAALDAAEMILWGSYCGVHTVFTEGHVRWWQERDWTVLVHPESKLEVVEAADGSGSTAYLWKAVEEATPGSKLVIGTEGHFVTNARELGKQRGVEVMHLADIPDPGFGTSGCGCATMSRNDPPHLAGMLDLLRKGQAPDANRVMAGDSVNELTGERDRLESDERAELVTHARKALERMIEIKEITSLVSLKKRPQLRRQQFFWCAADRRFIPSSRVGDGVVDCCDGADETMRKEPPTGPRLMPRCPASHDEVTTFQKGAARRRERFGGRTISDALAGQCVEKTLVPFTYVLCFGSRAEQREGGERRSLGDARAFDAVSRTWRHEGGDACPGDVARSATVEIECSAGLCGNQISGASRHRREPSSLVDLHTGAGPADYEILAVDEVSMCVYHIRVASPAGCDETRREELGPRLAAVEADGSPRIVNGWLLTRGERGEGMWYHVGTAATQLFAPEGWF